jgi:hypothetical protein
MEDRKPNKRKAPAPSPGIAAIQGALRGPVANILVECVPQLAGVPPDHAYEMIMNNPRLADTCFKQFRSERSRFNAVVRRRDGSPIEDDGDLMSCGRSLADAIALIVRAMAKRYFVTFDRSRNRAAAKPEPPSAWTRAMAVLGLEAAPDNSTEPKMSRAEELFRAFREFLLYEWQVPLIPYYAPLPVSVVKATGPLLLLLREPEQIEALGQIRLNAPKPAVGERATRKQAPADDAHPTFYLPPSPSRNR